MTEGDMGMMAMMKMNTMTVGDMDMVAMVKMTIMDMDMGMVAMVMINNNGDVIAMDMVARMRMYNIRRG